MSTIGTPGDKSARESANAVVAAPGRLYRGTRPPSRESASGRLASSASFWNVLKISSKRPIYFRSVLGKFRRPWSISLNGQV